MASLLKGVSLLNPDGSAYSSSLEGKSILLYFSASWCPPCKAFSPVLIEWYKQHHEKQNFEIVFVSSDRDVPSFKAYAGHFPFPSIAFEDRATKQKLSTQFGITGIPALIVVDKDGQLITKNGREGVTVRPSEFPWTPKTMAQELAGSLLAANGAVIPDAIAHFKGKKVALYFSASWCGPCKKFSPMLSACYEQVKKQGHGFEVVFISADRDEASFKSYFGQMPWTAFPYGDARIEALNNLFEVEGIPTCILLDGDSLRVLQKDLIPHVVSDPQGAKFPWKPEPVSDLGQSFMGSINEVASFLLLLPAGHKASDFDAALRATGKKLLDEAEAKGTEVKLRFAIAEHDNEMADSIRGFLNQNPQPEPEVVLLDIPSARKFVLRGAKVTAEWVADISAKFLSDHLEGAKGIKDGDFVPKQHAGGAHTHGSGGNCSGHGHGH